MSEKCVRIASIRLVWNSPPITLSPSTVLAEHLRSFVILMSTPMPVRLTWRFYPPGGYSRDGGQFLVAVDILDVFFVLENTLADVIWELLGLREISNESVFFPVIRWCVYPNLLWRYI